MRQRFLVKLLFEIGVIKEGLYFRAENKALSHKGVVKRLYAEHIARSEKRAVAAVEYYKGEHSAQLRHKLLAPLLKAVEQHLAVRIVGEGVPRL